MSKILEDNEELPARRHRYGSFGQRYPEYNSWLDGRTWELTYQELTISPGTVNGFRASLHYQAREQGLKLVTKTKWRRDEQDRPYRVLLVRADIPDPGPDTPRPPDQAAT